MTKDDEPISAREHALPRRAPGQGRMTAPGGTPINKLPIEPPRTLVKSPSSRPPSSGAQNTLSPPRTVGGRTARLLRGDMDDDDAGAAARGVRPRVPPLRGRPPPPLDDEEEETERHGSKAKPPPSTRGGTLRMEAGPNPTDTAPPGGGLMRPLPPARTPPVRVRGEDDPPSTTRGGSSRDLVDIAGAVPVAQAPSVMRHEAQARPVAAAPVVAAPVVALAPFAAAAPVAAPAPSPVAAPAPTGEITISASEFEPTAIPSAAVESRWPFAFAVGAVSLAIGSLLPLPFRQYIVPDHLESLPATSSAPSVATHDLVQQPAAPSHAVSPPPPSTIATTGALAPPVFVAPTASSAVRPLPFGSAKVPTKTNQGPPKDVF